MDSSIRFWNWYARRYAKQPIADPTTYQKKLDLTQKYFNASSRVLEFGCGTGSTAIIHAPKVGELIAIDSSREMIRIAEQRLADSGCSNVTFKCGTLFDLPLVEASFDVVLGLNVLHLIDDYAASIRRVHRLLKPGGVFATSTVCMGDGFTPWRYILPIGGALGLIPKVKFISVEQLERAFLDAGFALVDRIAPTKKHNALFLIAKK
ncbi:MAG: class I SAM-dependent methyltransferase [Deltaproteobacteria bacterium]|nr:class I SAM-dependent methyltransferase [Deltaproteobacteria bacterium]